MIECHRLTGLLTLTDAGPLVLPADLERKVKDLWAEALARNPALFDGPILLAAASGENGLILRQARYRHMLAARRDESVKIAIGGRPLAVSGLLSCRDGLLFGQRSAEVSQDPGHWELVPSGGVERPDLAAQILKELEEEIGLTADQVTVGAPLGLIADEEVIDVVLPLTTALSAQAIDQIHAARGSGEYRRLAASATPRDFIGRQSHVVATSRAILEHFAAGRI
jgi:8-oxo-dGTP pyrophosphatase MutT (NUDIX family)